MCLIELILKCLHQTTRFSYGLLQQAFGSSCNLATFPALMMFKDTGEFRQAMCSLNAKYLSKMMHNLCLEYHSYWL